MASRGVSNETCLSLGSIIPNKLSKKTGFINTDPKHYGPSKGNILVSAEK